MTTLDSAVRRNRAAHMNCARQLLDSAIFDTDLLEPTVEVLSQSPSEGELYLTIAIGAVQGSLAHLTTSRPEIGTWISEQTDEVVSMSSEPAKSRLRDDRAMLLELLGGCHDPQVGNRYVSRWTRMNSQQFRHSVHGLFSIWGLVLLIVASAGDDSAIAWVGDYVERTTRQMGLT
jgi:hypothetical protein